MNRRRLAHMLWDSKALVLVAALVVWMAFASHRFLTIPNITSIFLFMAIEGIIVIGLAYVMIAGEIDLSFGATMALGAVLAILTQSYGVAVGIAAAVAGGLAVGLANGFLVAKLKLDSIPATLGMMVLLHGLVFALTGGESVRGQNADFMLLANSKVWGIPVSVTVFAVLCVVFEFVLRRTLFGRNVYAVGGNPTASHLHGIPVDRVRIGVFLIVGGLSGLAGALLASKLNIATGQVGFRTLLTVITAVLLGGVSLAGGRGSVVQAFEGMLLIAVLNNALVLTHVPTFVQDVILGAVLIASVVVDSLQQRRLRFRPAHET